MFKFSFTVDEDENSIFKEEEAAPSYDECYLESCECSEVRPAQKHFDNLAAYKLHSEVFPAGSLSILHVKSAVLLKTFSGVCGSNISKAEKGQTDLIPGVYEGGAKIWECTEDLVTYLDKMCAVKVLQDKRVLDLGCGAGVLGIYAYKSNAAAVHFQDYNEDVLNSVTMPNILLNVPNRMIATISEKVKFYSGDWRRYVEATEGDEKFDVILTSETIYNPANYHKLLDTFEAKLMPTGFVLLAAKVYYFGVGGGLKQFEELMDRDKRFQCERVWRSEFGVPREILKINRRS